MPNPRTLGTGGKFTPKSIKGLALWLDGADPASLYTSEVGPVDLAGFSVLNIPYVVGWYSADNPNNTVVGGKVTVLSDRLGQYDLTQAVGSAQPSLVTNVLNGMPVVRFDGEDVLNAPLPEEWNIRQVFAVFRCTTAAGGNRRLLSVALTGGLTRDLAFATNSATTLGVLFGSPGTTLTGSISGFDGFSILTHVDTQNPGMSLRRNYDAAVATGTWSDSSGEVDTTLSVGAVNNGSSGFIGDLAELIVSEGILSSSDARKVERYLAVKYGISGVHANAADETTAVSSPLSVPGCVGWWDASDAASITQSGGLVSQWNDKSGNNRHATASGSLRPTSGGSQNGRTVMQFTGTQALTITGNFLQSDNVTMFAVAMKNTDHYGGIISSAPTNPEDSPLLGFYSTTLAFVNRRQVVQQAVSNGVYRIIAAQSVGTTQQGWFDGVKATDSVASVATNTSNTITKIGAFRTSSTADLNGNIAEIVCYSGNLSTTDRARVEKYLQQKWGTATVPDPTPPVGYWRDRSGNARHATQATAGSRPTISATNQGGKRAMAFASQTTTVISPATVAQYVADATTSPKMFFAWVARPEGGAASVVFGSPAHPNNASRVFYASDFGVSGNHIVDFGSVSTARLSGTVGDEANNVGHVYSAFRDGAVMSIRRDGVEILRKTNASGGYTDTTGTLSINTTSGGSATSSWMEFMAYAASMPSANIGRIERYLAAKWGITLAPQAANADAQDWINRVYANGGTVSSATAGAVNAFCDSIAGASLRDRFYRLNLFCGTGLSAALVPLYRGPSLGGTQYGGATDTNNAFVGAGTDYAETGATGGLTGNGTSKYLNTGLTPAALPDFSTGHLSVYSANAFGGSTIYALLSSLGAGYAENYAIEANRAAGGLYGAWGKGGTFGSLATAAQGAGNGHTLVTRTSNSVLSAYRNTSGTAIATSSASVTPATSSSQWSVFAHGTGGSPLNYAAARLGGYSIGASMTGPQAAAFYTAMQAFQTALGRQV